MIDAISTALTSNAQTMALLLLAFVAGAMCPAHFAMERFRGFGRAVVSKLPYQPPPGTDEEEALEQASDE